MFFIRPIARQGSNKWKSLSFKQKVAVGTGVAVIGGGVVYAGTARALNLHDPDSFVRRKAREHYPAAAEFVKEKAGVVARKSAEIARASVQPVAEKIVDRFSPKNLAELAADPEALKRYAAQRMHQMAQPLELYRDHRAFARRKMEQFATTRAILNRRRKELNDGLTERLPHSGRAGGDYAKDTAASFAARAIVGGAIAAAYFHPKLRGKTNAAMKSLSTRFPRLYGPLARRAVPRFFVGRPIAKLAGNPWFTLGAAAFVVGTGVGQSLRDRKKLMEKHPWTHEQLTKSRIDAIAASRHLGMIESIEKTVNRPASTKPPGK